MARRPERGARGREQPPRRPRRRGGGGRAGARLLAWLQEHPRAALGSLGRMWRNPAASLLTVAVIAVALALPGALWMLLKNAERATGGWDTGARVSVYLEPGLDPARAATIGDRIAARDDVTVVERISAEQALEEFRALAGFDEALEALERNPLPAVVVVEPAGVGGRSPAALGRLTGELEAIEGVDRAQLDLEWVERLYALLGLIERGVTVIALLLAAGVLLIIGNTIRLDILNRREEIEVTKLIGASDAFIRRPFLYTGLWYGLLGAALAWLLLAAGRALLAGPAARLAAAYGSGFRLHGLAADESGLLILAGAGLGLVGSWLAVGRHLRAIEPG
ncbi:MAG: permease-like cell division protein FtsX [Halofilum sp. (in: g-proteobacteria)]|nr:permease-like cell division protein FtsX [Halofilum sp. (in: g-proteobacteria)]